ncbi:peptide ABC transporter substrate-binding protein [Qiania dongpingensis]|uniref:Peptide ABC transporter substrate-binding protein n=1 Tax=Qiania dongpingensis TaxID=2763669 RepID=A0A7G9G4F4_9FIRM|nr:peptide ABC transporter substrate-binding protein [Qiania dongpingensis]QNM05686.1 peptide ABC transporter substrate-binding protein [Qiania dongpingensis]
MRKKLISALSLLLVVVMLASCGATGKTDKDETKAKETGAGGETKSTEAVNTGTGVTIRIPFAAEPSSLDPGFGNSSDSICPRGIMYEGLVRIYDNKIEPAIAESWDISDDGLTYTFHLRDTKWADGEPVTAQDFEYGIKRLLDPSEDAPNGNYSWMGYYFKNGEEFNNGECSADEVGVKALDEKTLEITAVRNMPYFLDLMKMPCFYPVRQDIAEQYGKDYASSPETVVCNGPFVLKQWDHESKLVFEKNPGYWNADAINVDTIEAYIISDENTIMDMFDNGELDITNTIPKEQIQKYIDNGEAVNIVGATIWYSVINVKTDRGEASKLLKNKSFRQAFSYAIDREGLVQAARGDGSFAVTRMMPDLMSICDSTWAEKFPLENPLPTSADTDKAAELFEQALSETGLSKDSLPKMTILTFDEAAAKTSATILQNVLKTNFNIDAQIDTQTYSARQDKENQGDYDFCITNWAPDYNDPMTFMECYSSGSSYNMYFGGFENADYDALIKEANTTDDMEKRAELLFQAETQALDEMFCVPLFQTSGYWGMKKTLTGVSKCGFGANDPDFARVKYVGDAQ